MSLRLDHLAWRVGGRMVLDGVDMTPPPGALTGLIGPNGAGKSTLLRLLAGVMPASGGQALLDGADLAALPRRERARRVALVEQEHEPVEITVADAVALGRTPHASRWGGLGPRDREVVAGALADAGVGGLAGRSLATLSGGERQRVHLARALAQEPELLLLDEPTNHLDLAARLDLLDVLGGLTLRGVTVLAALHDLNLAAGACDHVVLLAEGRVAAAGTVAEVLRPEVIEPVYGVACQVLTHPRTGRPVLVFDRVGDDRVG